MKLSLNILTLFLFFIATLSNAQSWEKTFTDNFGQGRAFDVISTSDGNYVMVGELDLPTGAIRHYIWMIKTDPAGNELWSKVYNSTDIAQQTGRAIVETADGDLLIAGSNFNKASVFKTNADGDSIWIKDFGGEGQNNFRDIIKMENDNFILTGRYEANLNSGLHKAWTVGMTADGDTIWTKRYLENLNFSASAHHISKLPSNRYLVSGIRQDQGIAIGVDPLAPYEPLSLNIYQVSTEEKFFAGSVAGSDDDLLLLAGSSLGFASTGPILIIADLENGTYMNNIPHPSINSGAYTDLIPTMDNGFLLTGSSNEFWSPTPQDIGFILKLDQNFQPEWEINYQDSLDIQGAAVYQNTDGSYLIAGSRQNGMFLKKIGGTTSTLPDLLHQQILVNLYPNPGSKNITLEIPHEVLDTPLSLSLFESTGKLLLSTRIQQAKKEIHIDPFPSGIYFYKIRKDEQIISTGKIIIQ